MRRYRSRVVPLRAASLPIPQRSGNNCRYQAYRHHGDARLGRFYRVPIDLSVMTMIIWICFWYRAETSVHHRCTKKPRLACGFSKEIHDNESDSNLGEIMDVEIVDRQSVISRTMQPITDLLLCTLVFIHFHYLVKSFTLAFWCMSVTVSFNLIHTGAHIHNHQ